MTHGERILVSLSSIFVLGIGSQWLASRLRIPSILLLLTMGIIAGPVTGMLNPDELLGDLILPTVSLAVAVVLFEGSLSLKLSDLRQIGRPLAMLLSVGVLITWILSTIGAHWILQFDQASSLLIGAILTVTGPTVIGPLLREIRPTGRVGPIARWEGIVIDPIGAVLAVLVFGAESSIDSDQLNKAAWHAATGFGKTMLTGVVVGTAAAFLLQNMLRRHRITDHLQSPFTLMVVITSFVVSNLFQHESGLVTVTVMGLILANQSKVSMEHIVEFKENLSVLLISSLFIVLSARLNLSDVQALSWRGPAFVAFLILVVRPLSVWVSTFGSSLTGREKMFLAWLAPRGIVAAAVASVFALQMQNSQQFVTAVFLVVVGTVLVYGLSAGWLARKVGLSVPNPQGVLIAGSHAVSRAIAHALEEHNIRVCLVDTNARNLQIARMEGRVTFYANILSETVLDDLDLAGIGRLMAMTPNDEVNSLAARRFIEFFGRKEVYRLSVDQPQSQRQEKSADVLSGRVLFAEHATYEELNKRVRRGAVVKTTRLSSEFTFDDFTAQYGEHAIVLFVISDSGRLTIRTTDQETPFQAGQTLIALIDG